MGAKAVVRYSEAFKQQVVEDVERGRFSGVHEAAGAYGVRGHWTSPGFVDTMRSHEA